jgi:ABC-type glycerol-3-phosphate transport system substrate-binding protein
MSTPKISRRQLLKMAGVSVAGSLIPACGGPPQGGAGTPAIGATAAPQPTVTAVGPTVTPIPLPQGETIEGFTPQMSDPSAPIRIVYWWGNNYEPALQFTNDVIARFSKAYPNVTIEPVAGQDCDAFITAAAAGTPPDLFHTWDCVERMGVWARRNVIIPLDDYIARSKFPLDDYAPGIMDTCRMDGKIWGMVDSAGVFLLWTRPPYFSEIGKPADALPQDTDEMWQWAKDLTKTSADGAIERLGMRLPNWLWEYFAWIANFGGEIWDVNAEQPTPDHPGVLAALNDLVAQVKQYGADNLLRWSSGLGAGEGAQNPWLAGNAVMQVSGDWTGQSIFDFFPDWKYGEQYNAAAPPPAPAGKRAGESAIAWWSWPWVIPSGTKYPDWSWEVLRYYLSTEYQIAVRAKFKEMPVRKSMINDERLGHPWIKAAREIINGQRRLTTMMPMNPVAAEYSNLLGEAIDGVLRLNRTPEDAMAQVKTETLQKLKDLQGCLCGNPG